ncbi:MAG: hypothetical protein ISN64_01160 [Rickettsia sp.]|nr:hypothetical protein [Rickettsia sp.]
MFQWEYGKDIQYLKEKALEYGIKCSTGSERGTSSKSVQNSKRSKG